jgi:hypothetical protein
MGGINPTAALVHFERIFGHPVDHVTAGRLNNSQCNHALFQKR